MQVTSEGSVRVDLVGGTLDLEPINLILPDVVTLNVATSLKAKVVIEETNHNYVEIKSLDYDHVYQFNSEDFTSEKLIQSDFFGPMGFVCQILDIFNIHSNVSLTLSSGAPAGSGLGGSSAMGITLYKALCKFTGKNIDVNEAVSIVKGVEGRILNQGVPGYQDYYPALLGGVLCLKGSPGKIHYEQLFNENLKAFLEDHITLVYSGISRQSGINNWDVYKSFFDGNSDVRASLAKIAKISHDTYLAIKSGDYEKMISLIGEEGECRKTLAKAIVPVEVEQFYAKAKEQMNNVGLKMCGAGGGGCFIIAHEKNQKNAILQLVEHSSMKVLDFSIETPVQ